MEQNPMKKCPQCQSDIPTLAKVCPQCRRDVRPKKPIAKYLLIFVVLIFAINVIAYSLAGTPAPSEPIVSNASPLEYAGIYSKIQIESLLKAPSTAKFPRAYAKDLGDGRYETSSYVDSENGFGAMIRSNWSTIMKYSGSNADDAGSWKTEKVIFDGKVVYDSK